MTNAEALFQIRHGAQHDWSSPQRRNTVKMIIAGGRDYYLLPEDYAILDRLHAQYGFTEVVHGAAPGADMGGDTWAMGHGIPRRPFPANWTLEGTAAGPIRNSAMVEYVGAAGMLVAFPGGSGTADITRKARKAGMPVMAFPAPEEGATLW